MKKRVYLKLMTKGFSGIFVLIGVLVIAAIAGGAYFFGTQKSQTSTPPITSEVSKPTPTTDVSDETANWKTYTKEKLVFKIPSDWWIKGNYINPTPLLNATDQVYSFGLFIEPNTTTTQEKENIIKSFPLTEIKEEDINISENLGIKIAGKVGYGPLEGQVVKVALFQIGDDVYRFENLNINFAAYFDQILSTFRFN